METMANYMLAYLRLLLPVGADAAAAPANIIVNVAVPSYTALVQLLAFCSCRVNTAAAISAIAIVAACAAATMIINAYCLRPASLGRALVREGLNVLPYHPVVGSLYEMKKEAGQRAAADHHQQMVVMKMMPNYDHNANNVIEHHRVLPRLFPFHSSVLSQQQSPGDGFVYWAGTQPVMVICNPQDAKDVLSLDVRHLEKSEATTRNFRKLLGNGLPLANGQAWHHQRNLLRPAFFVDKLKEMVGEMSNGALEMAQSWRNGINNKGLHEIDVAPHIKALTADVLARTAFGSSYEQGKLVFEKQGKLTQLLTKIRDQKSLIPGYRYLPTTLNRECMELETSIHDDLERIIQARRKAMLSGYRKTDLLGLILAAQDRETYSICHQQVIDECKAFFFVGHETTSGLLMWAIMLLAQSDEWQRKAREEVLELCGQEVEPKAEHLNKLKIMGMILNEALRLYPPVPLYGMRKTLPNQSNIKVGRREFPCGITFVILCLYIHTCKEVWGEDAHEFHPERFRNGASRACKNPYGYMPFGMGPRVCIGQTFAIMEAKVILATILQSFRFKLSPSYRHAPALVLTMEPKHGVQVILEPL